MDDPLMNSRDGCRTIVGSVLVAGAVTLLIVLVLFWRMSMQVTDGARRLADSVATTFREALNFTPEIRVQNVVLIAANTPVLELVTLKRDALVRHTWTHTWLHSTKTLELEATFTARAGFDLGRQFSVEIDPTTGALLANFPPPRLLSLSMSNLRILRDDDGFWNKLTAEDREHAIHELEERARQQFAETNLLPAARNAADEQIKALLDQSRAKVPFAPPTGPPR